ncbi:MAG: major capsid protein [Microvirus sp.]|nr:MAG: major capsid protein [Microvirus sp.]
MARPSIMSHDFSRVPRANIPRSSFDRSHNTKLTFNSGFLIPVFVDEAMPGDTFNVNMTAFARLATPLHPFMDNVYLSSFFFAVPMRLIWDNSLKFWGEQDNPGDSTDFLIPQIVSANSGGHANGSLHDYMGIPPGIPNLPHSALWARAYNLIWNTWFRDQNLQDSVRVEKGDGPDNLSWYTLLRRGKRHDYFTSALPWPQKGDSVDIPLGTRAPVRGIGTADATPFSATASAAVRQSGDLAATTFNPYYDSAGGQILLQGTQAGAAAYPDVYTDLTDATSATINQLRQAFQLQKLYERDARGGTRYTEIIRSHFGVTSPDARLQRPEYLGGGQSMVNLHTVPQTSATGDYASTPQANLAAYGTMGVSGHGFTQSFTEHCIVIGLVSVRADLTYQQGLNKMWSRRTKYDYYWPALSMIGEQAILNKEIYAQGGDPGSPTQLQDEEVFGYQERYAEFRYKPSTIHAQMRSSFAQSLDTWHLSQDFATLPLLNDAFIQDTPPIDRVIAVVSEPQFIMDTYFRFRAARPMPVYGVPGNIDRM